MKSSVNFRFAVFAAAGLVFGILFAYCLTFGKIFGAIVSATAAIIVFTVFTFFSSANFKNAGKVLCFLVFAICMAVGGLEFRNVSKNYENADLNGHILTVSGKIAEISVQEDYSRIILDNLHFSGAISGKSGYKIALSLYGEKTLRLGDEVRFTAAIKDRSLIYNGKFSASALSRRIKYFAEMDAENLEKVSSSPNVFQKCNIFIEDVLRAGLKENEFPIAYAMLTGNSDYIAEESITDYRDAGIAHIFAVSGLHIGFLATAIYFTLNKLKVKNYISFAITLACCIFYAGVCGFSASSVRAVIMFFFLNFAKIAGFKYDSLSALFAAAFIVLIISPAQLFCVGFLLSFTVVFTVLVLYNPLKKLLKFLPEKIAAPLSVSFSAEIGGAPILLCFFGKFASLGMFINILFIPIAGLIFVGLIVCTVLGGIFAPEVVLFVPEYALLGLNYVITSFDFGIFAIGGFTLGWFAVSYYGELVVAGGLINLKKSVKTALLIALAVITVAGTWTVNGIDYRRTYARVFGSENISAALFTAKDKNLLVISNLSGGRLPENRFSGFLKNATGDNISVVLLNSDNSVDLTAAAVKIRHITSNAGLNADVIYYCGERDIDAETAVFAIFPDVKAENMTDGDTIVFNGGKFEFVLGGKCLLYTLKGKNTGVFSSVKDGDESLYPNIKLKTAICVDRADGIKRAFNTETTVSFRPKSGYVDGETAGYITLLLV